MTVFPPAERDRWETTRGIAFIAILPSALASIWWAFSTPEWGAIPVRMVLAVLFSAVGCAAAVFYMLPSAIAGYRGHHNTTAIMALNFLLGWTFLGWLVAIVWALTNDSSSSSR